MKMPSDHEFLLAWAKEISQDHAFWDFHAHPFCVLSGNTKYQPKTDLTGVYSTNDSTYLPPQFELGAGSPQNKMGSKVRVLPESALLLSSRLIYTFSGPKVFSDFIDYIGISNVMLLPLVRASGNAYEMLEDMAEMFSCDSRFKIGCPLPVGLSPQMLSAFFQDSQKKWGIQSIKIHPNLSGIDPTSKEGEDFLNAVLESAGTLRLPIVVHGGRTPGITPVENREFATLSRLSKINWSQSSSPVIIAHAGCYGLEADEFESAIHTLDTMLGKHPNLMVDTSALDLPILHHLMTKIDRKRFIFGSDALYFSIWSTWVTLLQVLTSLSPKPEEDLIRIASLNPQNCLPSRDE